MTTPTAPQSAPVVLSEEEKQQLRTNLSWCYEPTDRGHRIEADALQLEGWIERLIAARLSTVEAELLDWQDETLELRESSEAWKNSAEMRNATMIRYRDERDAARSALATVTDQRDKALEFIQACIDGTQNGSDLAYMSIPPAKRLLAAVTSEAPKGLS